MIRNIKQATNLANQNRVLRAANRIAHILSKTEKIEESIEELMTEFLEVVQADEGSIQLLRPSSQRTQRTLIRKAGEKNSLLKNRIDDLMTGWTVRHAKTLLTDNVTAVFNLGPSGEKYADIGSILAARLVAKEEAIGVVNLVRSGRRDRFTGDDKEVLTLLCEEISEFIEVAQLREKLFSENERLKQELAGRFDRHGIIGKSAALKEVFTLLNHVAPTDGRVMIHGESGTGKELIAKYIHNAGPRKDRPFIAVDCGALPGNLLESELFGYVRGAFTGANKDRDGLFQEANGGTLFLDEIANTSLETQAKLLRVLQENEIRPLGSNRTRKVDVRIIVASSQNLRDRVEAGEFRQDLYYRLNVVPIPLPPLRQRIEDIALIASHFVEVLSEKHKKRITGIHADALKIMEKYKWPGNVRELENVMERGVIMAGVNDDLIKPSHLPDELTESENARPAAEIPSSGDLTEILDAYEKQILLEVLENNKWNKTAAARALNVSERVIRYKMHRLGIDPAE